MSKKCHLFIVCKWFNILNTVCCLSSRARVCAPRAIQSPAERKNTVIYKALVAPGGACGPFSVVINFVSLAVLFS